MNDYYRCYINGVEYKALDNWQISEKSGSATMSTFSVLVDEGQKVPESGDIIEIKNNSNILFFGTIGIPRSPQWSSYYQPKIYELSCNNANSILARRIPNVSYQNKTITEIVQDLFVKYISQEGFTLGEISQIDSPVFEIYNNNSLNLQMVLNELAGYVEASWYCSNDKIFNFKIREDFERVNINRNNAIFTQLQRTDNSKDLRTLQIVEGGTANTTLQTEIYTYNGQSSTDKTANITTIYPIAFQPTIYVNGVICPDVGVKGLVEDTSKVLFLWSYQSNTITINANSYTGTTSISNGAVIKVEYIGMFYIRVEVVNNIKQNEIAQKTGTSGIIENYYNDTGLKTIDDTYAKANGLLLTFGEQRKTLTLTLNTEIARENGFDLTACELLKEWEFDLPEIDIVESFVLVEKTTRPFVKDDFESLTMTLSFTNRNFVQTYGELISKLYKDTNKLSVREGVRIIQYNNISENTGLVEEMSITYPIINYVCESLDNGQIATPLGSLYPYLSM